MQKKRQTKKKKNDLVKERMVGMVAKESGDARVMLRKEVEEIL